MRRLVLLILAVGAGVTYGQTNITGYWDFQAPRTANNDGTYREYFFELKQDGETITGRLNPNGWREMPIAEGTLHNGALHFVIAKTVYEGTLAQDGKFTFASIAANGSRTPGELVRTSKEAALPPPRIAPPALHDVSDNGLARTPPMGWNSWNRFKGLITDADVRGIANSMVSTGMAKAGYRYINIDDTWEGQARDANGNITTNRKFSGHEGARRLCAFERAEAWDLFLAWSADLRRI
jgi:alpha-galactosidase